MAKPVSQEVKRDCLKCTHCPGIVANHMVDCNSKERNPKGYKIGYWPQVCRYFKQKV